MKFFSALTTFMCDFRLMPPGKFRLVFGSLLLGSLAPLSCFASEQLNTLQVKPVDVEISKLERKTLSDQDHFDWKQAPMVVSVSADGNILEFAEKNLNPEQIEPAAGEGSETPDESAGTGRPYNPADMRAANPNLDLKKNYTLYRLTPDKIKIVELPREPDSVIVGNQDHLSVFFDTQRRAALVPRQPGASFFQIYDREGRIMVQGHAIVASPERDYVRIRRTCANGGEGCETTSVYFCPGMCHRVSVPLEDDAGGSSGTDEIIESTSVTTSSQGSEEQVPLP